MSIFVDADGCPVVDLVVRHRQGRDVFLVCDTAHQMMRE